MKTIKQIADELGIPKQRVYRFIKAGQVSEAHQQAGVMYFDEAAETRIKSHFIENQPNQDVHHETHQTASNDAPDTRFDTLISMFRDELAEKNNQIAALTAALENTTASLKAAQALHAGTMKHSLPDADAVQRERGIFARIFGKHGK